MEEDFSTNKIYSVAIGIFQEPIKDKHGDEAEENFCHFLYVIRTASRPPTLSAHFGTKQNKPDQPF